MSTLGLSFFLYTAGILAVGIYSTRFGRKTSSDFLLADRGLGAWVAALSLSASAESGRKDLHRNLQLELHNGW
jgi:Na+/proline symporter